MVKGVPSKIKGRKMQRRNQKRIKEANKLRRDDESGEMADRRREKVDK